ncbi:MAG: RNase adapter RapZ [Clostridia bacterium]|nr:RNase adapter RapZ [Clostridia bacterium]
MRCVIVTGMSGAGRTMALHQLEDMGYFCVDNMPPQMIIAFITSCMQNNSVEKAALVVDTRAGVFFDNIYQAVDDIGAMGVQCDLLFLETADEVLIRRYKESRRRHPLDADSVLSGIAQERKRMAKLREMARYVIDTSVLLPRELGDMLWAMFSDGERRDTILPVVVSFGYKNGIPVDADLVFDVRFLPNPYYDPELRMFSGLDEPVRSYVYDHEVTREFEEKLMDMLLYLLPHYQQEGKFQLVIAIGCTGGRHRSVAVAQSVYKRLKETGMRCVVQHRDIGKDALKA